MSKIYKIITERENKENKTSLWGLFFSHSSFFSVQIFSRFREVLRGYSEGVCVCIYIYVLNSSSRRQKLSKLTWLQVIARNCKIPAFWFQTPLGWCQFYRVILSISWEPWCYLPSCEFAIPYRSISPFFLPSTVLQHAVLSPRRRETFQRHSCAPATQHQWAGTEVGVSDKKRSPLRLLRAQRGQQDRGSLIPKDGKGSGEPHVLRWPLTVNQHIHCLGIARSPPDISHFAAGTSVPHWTHSLTAPLETAPVGKRLHEHRISYKGTKTKTSFGQAALRREQSLLPVGLLLTSFY